MLTRILRQLSRPALPESVLSGEEWQFARKLVSEIEHEDIREVSAGRWERDVGLRFDARLLRAYKELTERFGQGYESERIFKAAVVEILAGGDVQRLGDTSWIRWLGDLERD